MKKKVKTVLSLFAAGMLLLSSCNNETGVHEMEIPQSVIEEFNRLYPGASNVLWHTHGSYAVASFYYAETRNASDPRNNTAWFAMQDGQWGMTETEIPFSMIPEAVRNAFMNSPYADWKVDETVDVLKRNENETLYVIEVELRGTDQDKDVDLYYTEDGTLVKETVDDEDNKDYDELLPEQPSNSVMAWIEQNFPGARIIDIDIENGCTEVEIVHERMLHEILFDHAGNWLYTKTDLDERDLTVLPAVVLETLKTTEAYQTMVRIDDIERYTTQTAGVFYAFDIELGYDKEVKVYIQDNGTLLDQRPDLGTDQGGVPVQEDVQTFIEQNYPGAQILEKDYDDGYLEVEIRHDGKKKELKFNGKNEWLRTEWELGWNELPEVVKNTLQSQYAGYRVDEEIKRIESPQGNWYEVELEDRNRELEVWIDDSGKVIKERFDD